MNQKQIGVILLIIGIALSIFVYLAKVREDKHIEIMIQQSGTCFLTDGTCLHADRDFTLYIFGWVLSEIGRAHV